MRARWLHLFSAAVFTLALATTGCADDTANAAGEDVAAQEGELRGQLTDAQLMGKLRGILRDVTFTSEGDYPYVVFEGEAVAPGTRLGTRVVREKLGAAVLANSSANRDIRLTTSRARRLNVTSTIAEGNAAEVPSDRNADDWVYAYHDKQLSIALKTMRAQLKNVVGFSFGTNESGDQDEIGTVHYVYVGVSKTTGKLIAIMTEAVYT